MKPAAKTGRSMRLNPSARTSGLPPGCAERLAFPSGAHSDNKRLRRIFHSEAAEPLSSKYGRPEKPSFSAHPGAKGAGQFGVGIADCGVRIFADCILIGIGYPKLTRAERIFGGGEGLQSHPEPSKMATE
jgi:hypothetical protein